MRRFLVGTAIGFLLCGVCLAQSLGDVARENRATPKKKAAHVYTNDEIPSVKTAPDAKAGDDASAPAKEDGAAKTEADSSKDSGDKDAADKASKPSDPIDAAIAQQKEKVSLLERELDVMQREYKLQTVTYYADAGTRLRDPKDWVEQRKKYEEGIAAKKKDLAEAKAALEAMQEDARKSGTPPSSTD